MILRFSIKFSTVNFTKIQTVIDGYYKNLKDIQR